MMASAVDFSEPSMPGRFINGVFVTINSAQGINTSTGFLSSVLELISHITECASPIIDNLNTTFSAINGGTNVISLIYRIKKWVYPDNDKYLWENGNKFDAVLTVNYNVCLTAFKIVSVINFLQNLKIVNICSKILSPLNYVAKGAIAIAMATDIVQNARSLIGIPSEVATVKKQLDCYKIPDNYAGDITIFLNNAHEAEKSWFEKEEAAAKECGNLVEVARCAEHIKKLKFRANFFTQTKNAGIQNDASITNYCNDRAKEATDDLHNLKMKQVRSWVWIAMDICVIACIALSCILPFVTAGGLLLSLLIVGVAASAFELAGTVLEEAFKDKPIARRLDQRYD